MDMDMDMDMDGADASRADVVRQLTKTNLAKLTW